MAITLSANYLKQIASGSNSPNTIIEVALDSGTVKWGTSTGGFNDVQPIIKNVSSLQNKIDTKSGFTTRGQLHFVVTGREIIKRLVKDEFLKNRRIIRKDGFDVAGFDYSDYADTFTGKIVNWTRKGDELTITAADDLAEAIRKIPVENNRKTQYVNYQNTNPVNVMKDILSTQLGISTAYINSTAFDGERDLWLNNVVFDRVINKPENADKYLNELQIETNSYIVHEGDKISFKYFGPPTPNQNIETWTDDNNILEKSFSMESGYEDNFANRIIVYYDYDESGSNGPNNFESIYITQDSSSLSTSEWNETKTKEIKSKWIRTRTYTQPTNVTGVTMYHVSIDNSTGTGTLTFSTGSSANTMQWAAPGGSAGAAVSLNKSGAFRLFDSDTSKSVRVLVDTTGLPAGSTSDSISITGINGNAFAQTLGDRHLRRFRDPIASVKFSVDMNNAAWNANFVKPTDIKFITSDEAFDKNSTSWADESIMITSVRPDANRNRLSVEGVQTKLYRRYGYIAPNGFPDYPAASAAQRQYAFIANSSAELEGSTNNAYHIW
ncbi:MAG: hypothetical protein MJA29_04355 [Candidatus Omnitrophica bacterium]|nr:hypothetical protein [Candidatus Omnitrophota bacterium]